MQAFNKQAIFWDKTGYYKISNCKPIDLADNKDLFQGDETISRAKGLSTTDDRSRPLLIGVVAGSKQIMMMAIPSRSRTWSSKEAV